MALSEVYNIKAQYKGEQYQYENVVNALECPSEIRLDSDGMMTCVIKDNGQNFVPNFDNMFITKRLEKQDYVFRRHFMVIKAPPVLMALCLGRDDLVKELIEYGNKGKEEFEDIELCVEIIATNHISIEINIGEFIFFDNTISDDTKLYILKKMLMNKRKLAKKNKDTVSISWLRLFCSGFIDSQDYNEKKYVDEFMRVFKMIYARKPRCIKNMVTKKEFINLICCFDLKSQCEIWLFVLENITKSENQRYKLFKKIVLGIKIEILKESRLLLYKRDVYEIVTNFFRETEKYYNSSEILRRVFLCAVIRNYNILRQRILHSDSDELFCNFFENGIKMLIQKYSPKECSFKEYMRIVVSALNNDLDKELMGYICGVEDDMPREFEYMVQLYKKFYKRDIIIDSSLIFRADYELMGHCKVIDSEKILIYADAGFNKCISMIDHYCFDDNLPLNNLQMNVLNMQDEVVIREMKKGVFKGEHISKAIEMCYDNNRFYLIPCIMAFQDKIDNE